MASIFGRHHDHRQGFHLLMNLGFLLLVLGLFLCIFQRFYTGLFVIMFGIFIWCTSEIGSRPPVNSPMEFLKFVRNMNYSRPVLVCIGDSLTHGQMGCSDYTSSIILKLCDRLGMDLPAASTTSSRDAFEKPVWVVNAGQNFVTTSVLTQYERRIEQISMCYPDYALIMLGTTDVLSMYSSMKKNYLIKTWNTVDEPSMEILEKNLNTIIDNLISASPMTQIGICTLPPIGEDLTHPINRLIKQANNIIHNIVKNNDEEGISYGDKVRNNVTIIPIFEKIEQVLMERSTAPKINNIMINFLSSILHLVLPPLHHYLGISYNNLSKPFGYYFSTDSIHFNERGRDVVTSQVVQWLLNRNVQKAIAVKSF